MMRKTTELSGAALDWAVAEAEMLRFGLIGFTPAYSSGPYGDGIATVRCNDLYFPGGNEAGAHYGPYWQAMLGGTKAYGTNPREAAMRCYVLHKTGEEVDVPKEFE